MVVRMGEEMIEYATTTKDANAVASWCGMNNCLPSERCDVCALAAELKRTNKALRKIEEQVEGLSLWEPRKKGYAAARDRFVASVEAVLKEKR